MFEKCKNDIKATWRSINLVLKRNSSPSSYPREFIINGKSESDKQIIANEFNKYYVNVGPNLAQQIVPPPNTTFRQYLDRPPDSEFSFNLVSSRTVLKVINSLQSKKSSGYDSISSQLLKEIKNEILEPVTLIINQCITTGIFPDKLKIAKVVPIYKKDDEKIIGNYRPISLLPAISKIFEKIIHNQLYQYFTNENLFYKSQYGFRKNFY